MDAVTRLERLDLDPDEPGRFDGGNQIDLRLLDPNEYRLFAALVAKATVSRR
jgi:hypothetical protein